MVDIRYLLTKDLDRGFLETLSALTDVDLDPEKDRDRLWEIYDRRLADRVRTFVAIEDGQVVGTASMLIEQKFLHRGGKVAHVEDVAVRQDRQRKEIGSTLMGRVEQEAKMNGCYKIILDSSSDNWEFYSKLGYYRHETQMRKDL